MTSSINDEVTKRQDQWFGSVVRIPEDRLHMISYRNNFETPKPPGRPQYDGVTQLETKSRTQRNWPRIEACGDKPPEGAQGDTTSKSIKSRM